MDKKKFEFNLNSLNWDEYFYYHIRGIRTYILNETNASIEEGHSRIKK